MKAVLRKVFCLALILLSASQARAQCSESERKPWVSAAKLGLSIEAHAIGPACATAAIVLLVTNKNDEVVYSFIREAKSMMWFQDDVGDGAAMKLGLKNWLESATAPGQVSTSTLPDWKAGAEQPEREGDGEFGYFPREYTNRESYLEARAASHPMFCFVSGMESTTCVYATGPNNVSEIGGFSFPG